MKDRLNDLCENISRVKSLFFAYTSSQTDMRDKGIIEEDLIKLFNALDKMIIRLYKDISFYKNMEDAFGNAIKKIEKMRTCYNCKYKNSSTEKCEDCVNKCKWELTE